MAEILSGASRRPVQRQHRKNGWNQKACAVFLDTLAMTGNVRHSARTAERSLTGAYWVRQRDPAFAAAWDAALDTAYVVLEAELLAQAIDAPTSDYVLGDGAVDDAQIAAGKPDNAFRVRVMTLRDGRGQRRVGRAQPRLATLDEVISELVKKLDARARRERRP